MDLNYKNNKQKNVNIEMIIMCIVAVLMMFLIGFSNRKLNEVITSDREALLLEHREGDPVHEDLAREIINFRPDACKMIEAFSDDYQLIFRVQFREDDGYIEDTLSNYPELVKLFDANEDGHTEITINDEDEDVYFRWTMTTAGERQLFIIYMSRPVVKNLWVVPCTCYIILILIMFVIMRLKIKSHAERIRHYQTLSSGRSTR